MNQIGDRLRELRGDMTDEAFAELLGQTPTRLKDVMRAKQRIPADMLQALLEKTGVDLNWLVGGAGGGLKVALTVREAQLLDHYRLANEDGKRAVDSMAKALAQGRGQPLEVELPARRSAGVVIHGRVKNMQTSEGDMHITHLKQAKASGKRSPRD